MKKLAELPLILWQYTCTAAAAAKSRQACPTVCDPIDSSPQGSPVHGIFQAIVLQRGAIAFSKERHRTAKLAMLKVAIDYNISFFR